MTSARESSPDTEPDLRSESSTVLSELGTDGVLTLTLNRPERNNAWNTEMEHALHHLLFRASESSAVIAIVLTGAGRSFCPGMDSQSLTQSAAGNVPTVEGRTHIYLPLGIPKPVVCAINGACAGLGLVTALACDVRFANAEAKLATAFSKRGLPAEEGISWLLSRIVGHASALDLLLSSRTVTGREAASLGMVHFALPAEEVLPAALEYAREMARTCSPLAMATIKRQVYDDWSRSVAGARQEARGLMYQLRRDPDFHEGVTSFVERRPPHFQRYLETIQPADYAMEPDPDSA